MIAPEDDNGIIIFYKLKENFFDENMDEEQIAAELRQDPIRNVGRILLILTEQYSRKLSEIIEPLQEENAHLIRLLASERQKLQHSFDDNQIFKAIIDRLEEEKKESDLKLNQSIEDFERSRQDIGNQKVEKQKIKSQAFKIFQNYQQICFDYNQLKEAQLFNESEIAHLKQTVEKLKKNNEDILQNNVTLAEQYATLVEQKQELIGKLATKEEFIASIVDQSHKIQFFKHQDLSIAKLYANQEKGLLKDQKDELTEFNFNEEAKFETSSHASISLPGTVHRLSSEIDEKFMSIQAGQRQKNKNEKFFDQSRKSSIQIDSIASLKKGVNLIKKESKNIKSPSMCSSTKKLLQKTVSSKNLLENNKRNHQSPSDYDEQRAMIEAELKKKINLKDEKINALETELMKLRNQFMEQRQNTTLMEGQYEIQIDELNNKLAFVNSKLNQTYQSYINAKIQSQMFEEKTENLEEQLLTINCEHELYCEQLKKRCKDYVLKRIDEVQQKYEEMKMQMARIALNHQSEQQEHIQSQQMEPLHFEKPEEERQYSDVYSYERLSNHFINGVGFDLDLSSNRLKNEQVNQIYIRQHFEIESDLGGFTERLNQVKQFSIKDGAFTDRDTKGSPFTSGKDQWKDRIQKKLKITFDFRVYSESFVPKIQVFTISQSENVMVTPKIRNLMINQCMEDFIPSRERKMAINVTFNVLANQSRQKILTVSQPLYDISLKQKRIPKLSLVNVEKYCQKFIIESKCKIEPSTNSFFFYPKLKLFSRVRQTYNFIESSQKQKTETEIQTDEQKQYQETSTSFSRQFYQQNLNLCPDQIQITLDHHQAFLIEQLNTKKLHRKSKTSSFKLNSTESEFAEMKAKQRLYTNHEELKETNETSTQPEVLNETKKQPQHAKLSEPLKKEQIQVEKPFMKSAESKKPIEESSSPLFNFQKQKIKTNYSAINHLKYCSEIKEQVKKQQHVEEEKKPPVCEVVPPQIAKYLSCNQYSSLCTYIQKNNVKIELQDIIHKKTFKRPSSITKKVMIFTAKTNINETLTFILNSSKIICLQTKRQIKFDRNRLINESNFMFGQSEVSVTRNGHLLINREGKRNKLSGNLEDGDWTIDSYISCSYELIE